MAKIIPFPGEDERERLELDKVLEETLNIDDPDLKACIKEGLAETLSHYHGIPSFSFKVPIYLSDEDLEVLSESLGTQYKEHVVNYAYSLIGEICRLQTEICHLKRKQASD